MSNTLYITDRNPEVFFAALADQVKAGYYVTDTIPGMPRFELINEVELTQTDKPSQRHDLSEVENVHISAYNETIFLLDVQDAILQGFEIIEGSVSVDVHSLLRASLQRPTEANEESPAKKAGRPRKQDQE